MVKLSTGKEFDVKPLTIEQRLEIDEKIQLFYAGVEIKGNIPPFPYTLAYKAIRYCVESDELEKLTNLEVVELYNEIFRISHVSEIQKKS